MNKRILKECLRISKNKNTEKLHPEYGNYHHFSFLIWKGKILSWATNRKGTANISHGYPKTSKAHSEYEVVSKNLFKWGLGGTEIINVRLNKFNQTRLSKPCRICINYMAKNGIKSVAYSVENEEFEEIKL